MQTKKIFKFGKINLSIFSSLKIIFLFSSLTNSLLSNDVEIIFGISYPSLRSFDDSDIFVNVLGTSWKYAGIKVYYFYENLATEIRYNWCSKETTFFSLRKYFHLPIIGRFKIFCGGETGYFTFDKDNLLGNGYKYGFLVGTEYFISSRITLFLDFVYAFLAINTNEDFVNGIEKSTNIGLSFYFLDTGR